MGRQQTGLAKTTLGAERRSDDDMSQGLELPSLRQQMLSGDEAWEGD